MMPSKGTLTGWNQESRSQCLFPYLNKDLCFFPFPEALDQVPGVVPALLVMQSAKVLMKLQKWMVCLCVSPPPSSLISHLQTV